MEKPFSPVIHTGFVYPLFFLQNLGTGGPFFPNEVTGFKFRKFCIFFLSSIIWPPSCCFCIVFQIALLQIVFTIIMKSVQIFKTFTENTILPKLSRLKKKRHFSFPKFSETLWTLSHLSLLSPPPPPPPPFFVCCNLNTNKNNTHIFDIFIYVFIFLLK